MTTTPNWNEIRKLFPAAEKNVYLFTAGSGPLSKPAYEAYQNYSKEFYEAGDLNWFNRVERVEECRKEISAIYGAEDQSDCGFTGSTSMGMNLFAMMMAKECEEAGKKKRVLVPMGEFPSTFIPWRHHGFELVRCEPEKFEARIESESDLSAVICSFIQSFTGRKFPIYRIGKRLDELGVPFFLNATQGFGVHPLDVQRAKISGAVASCHKWFCSSYGAAALFGSKSFRKNKPWPIAGWLSVPEPFDFDNEDQPLKDDISALEVGVGPVVVLEAMYESAKLVRSMGVENISARVLELSEILIAKMGESLPQMKLLSPRDKVENAEDSVNTSVVSFACDDPGKVAEKLAEKGIYLTARGAGIRVALHYYNNENDIDRLVEGLREVI